ncbi:MAG: hypothetical protein K9K79_00680 [Desulfohalobiaceae bacterium]|nr:hypothetical protein [Desulfohalobiaceae bacterium]
MRFVKSSSWLLLVCLILGAMLQPALAQEEDLELRRSQVIAQSQNQLDTAQIALEEAQAAKERLAGRLETTGENDPQREALEAALVAAEAAVQQAESAFEQVQSSHNQVLTLADQAGSAASDTEAEAALALAEAAASNGEIFSTSLSYSLEAVVQFEAGNQAAGQELAALAQSSMKAGQASQDSLQLGMNNLDQNNFPAASEAAEQVLAQNQATTSQIGTQVAGGPGTLPQTGPAAAEGPPQFNFGPTGSSGGGPPTGQDLPQASLFR